MRRPGPQALGVVLLAGLLLAACAEGGAGTATPQPSPAQAASTPLSGPGVPTAPGTWAARAPLPTPRSEVASAVLDGRIYVIAGFLASGAGSDLVEAYDPAADRWERRAPLPVARDHAVAAAHAGRLYVFGGGAGGPTRTAFAYDSASNSWTRLADMPFRRTAGGAAVLGDLILVVGGTGDSPAATMLYDPARDAWSRGPDLPAPREHLAVTAAAGKVYVVGGRWQGSLKATNEVLESPAGPWRTLAPMPTARGGTAGGTVDGRVFVAGGEAFDPSRTFPQVEVFDPATGVWASLPPLPTPRHGLAVQGVGDFLYVIGGGPTAGLSVSPSNEAYRVK